MKRCLECNEVYDSAIKKCPCCNMELELIDEFCAYAPEMAHAGGGFKSNYFATLAELEDGNFWFRSRNRLIIWALKKYAFNFHSLLEIGCGTGYVLSGIVKAFPTATFKGSEIFTAGLGFASNRLPSVDFMQMDARDIPFVEEFDVVGAFDVLEHINEDQEVLEQIYQALKPNGVVLITVPQHNWLWSPVDDYACHVRRYSAKELNSKLTSAGFDVLRNSSFVTSLLPIMLISRLKQRFFSKKNINPEAGLNLPGWINWLFEQFLNIEIEMIRLGINFPLGGSRIVVARKL